MQLQHQVVLKPYNLNASPRPTTSIQAPTTDVQSSAALQLNAQPSAVLQLNANGFAEPSPDPEVPDPNPNPDAPEPDADAPNPNKTIAELVTEAYSKDPLPNEVLKQLKEGQLRSKQLSLAECQQDDEGHLLYRG